MGNSNRKLQLMNEHEAEMAMIRNQHDEKEKKLAIEKLALEHNLEKHRNEIERLAKLDAYHYNLEKGKLEAEIRKNELFHQREVAKIKNQQMDIIMKRENEAEKNRQDFENVRKNNENNFECKIREINRQARKDNCEHEENIKNINNNYLLKQSEINNNFTLREKKLNDDYDLGKRELMIKENKDKLDYQNRQTELQNNYNLGSQKIAFQNTLIEKKYHKEEIEIKNEHELKMEESKRKTQKLEADIELDKTKVQKQSEDKKLETEKQYEEKMAQMKYGQDKEMECLKNNHEEKMKKMDADEKEREHQRNIESMKVMAGIQAQYAMLNLNIMKEVKSMNQKGQENISSNMQFPFAFPMFGMNNMSPNNMINSPFGYPFMNMNMDMNMMNNYQKPEK